MIDRPRIRLIALDIDGTLVGEDLVIGPRTRAAVAEAARRGISVSLVTGRMASSALPFAAALRLTAPIVGQQGALIRAMPTSGSPRLGRLLFHRPIAPELAQDVVRWAYENDLSPHFNYLERLVVQADEPRLPEFRRYVGNAITIVDSLLERAERPVTKIVVVADDEGHPPPLLDEARARFGDTVSVTLSHPRFLEFLAPGISKGYAIRWLARRLRVPLEETLAVGDQHNDLEMISEAGHGVAMPTAPAIVRAAARYVAPPVEEEGVAQIIEQLALGGDMPDQALHVPEAMEAAEAIDTGWEPGLEPPRGTTDAAPEHLMKVERA